MDEGPELDALVAAAVRREIGRVTRRYAPLVIAAVVFGLVVALVPTVDSKHNDNGNDVAAGASAGDNRSTVNSVEVDGGSLHPGSAPDGGTSASAPASGTDAGATPAAGGPASGATDNAAASGSGGGAAVPSATGSASGVARSGVTCGKDVKQVPWSAYAPPCIATFGGDNGGATSHGVTKDTITVTFRRGQSTEDAAVYAAAADAAPAPDPDFVADLRTYIDYFNKQYELYGRKVVLKDFQGQGDYIQEDQGQGQANAAADGATAAQLGGFADVTFPLKGSRPFWESLARNKVVAIGPLGFPQSWYERYAPYWYSAAPVGSQTARWYVNLVCTRMTKLPAIFADDALYQKTQRVFGLVTPENPEYLAIADEITSGLSACGQALKFRGRYSINVATFQTQATSLAAQMKSQGVTTALCYCDPLVPIFLSNAAQSQNWKPEWVQPYYGEPQGRLMDQSQWAHAMSNGSTHPLMKDTEAAKVWKLASPNAQPREQYFDTAYYTVLFLMNTLQAAGPNLTPQTLAAGVAKLPATPRGDVGAWTYGAKKFSPISEVPIAWWNPNGTSGRDGKKGAWISCDGGTWYPYDNAAAWANAGTQPKCFGR